MEHSGHTHQFRQRVRGDCLRTVTKDAKHHVRVGSNQLQNLKKQTKGGQKGKKKEVEGREVNLVGGVAILISHRHEHRIDQSQHRQEHLAVAIAD